MTRASEDTLFRLREVDARLAKVRLLLVRARIAFLICEMGRLRRRRDSVILRGSGHTLEDRVLLDALSTLRLVKGRELEHLAAEASVLLGAYKEARSRRDVVDELRKEKRLERELILERRADEAAGDAAAWRTASEREEMREGE